ncbi:hypothetical protein ROZALSC1DRAFT_27467 [Rozella allomycis CSF55]|uniref:Cleavage stimulation factor subunit 2, hinge domain-containing protein n=1 Tax=Rozella allomycis (strain CSF55) TaxID=988480 RepID=A0A075APB7_ROZAC|nr:Cleavage stimulation factor subunit 2, hinge domain-containing protein [Rozella allomycis CSF55]RKP21090.1 hypothetical protein ROZALSC1DRAFT_27467 [Rozella allomycis CSF55]|eukprot:EPZ31906.1 Cleavage stimulation factor subunit 2, hinge domain-containing protein [Rozella allomycis CSF55]
MSTKTPTRVVFIGNIPFDVTEEQIVDIFSQVGRTNERLMFDRETGRPKGYGFCQYPDAETASSAVRNLANYDIGGRHLRVDFADNDNTVVPNRDNASNLSSNFNVNEKPRDNSVKATDQITNTVASFTPAQLLDILTQMKTLVQTQPDRARAFLNDNPQLVYALFQAMLVTNLIHPSIVQSILQGGNTNSYPTNGGSSNNNERRFSIKKSMFLFENDHKFLDRQLVEAELKNVYSKYSDSLHDRQIMLYTCKICCSRHAKSVSKTGYNSGVVLIRCPKCENLHLIADHLNWFQEGKNLEEILRNKGINDKVSHDHVSEFLDDSAENDAEKISKLKEQ